MTELLRAAIAVSPDSYEAVGARLLELEPSGIVEEEGNLVVYTDAAGVEAIRARFAGVEVEPLAPGWENEWRRLHVPAIVGPLWIGPPWLEQAENLTPVVIDPGRAFGTGSHETTRLCVELLVELAPGGAFLDVGCGSGVLAIAAAKLGFGPVIAVDIDDAAVDSARRNARANAVDIDVRLGDAGRGALPAVDVAAANVTLETVEALSRRLDAEHLVASGYLVTEEPRLRGFRRVARLTGERFAADLYARE